MKNNLLICDLETGGLSPEKNPITQVTIEVVEPIHFKSLHYYSTFVKPYNNLKIEAKALEHSRVSMKQIETGVSLQVLMKGILDCFKRATPPNTRGGNKPYFVGHNFGFDIEFFLYLFLFMKQELFQYVQRSFFDTMGMMRLYEGNTLKASQSQKYNLTACCERLGVTLHGAHGAENDVEATKQLFIKLVNLQRNANPNHNPTTEGNSNSKQDHPHARKGYHFEF